MLPNSISVCCHMEQHWGDVVNIQCRLGYGYTSPQCRMLALQQCVAMLNCVSSKHIFRAAVQPAAPHATCCPVPFVYNLAPKKYAVASSAANQTLRSQRHMPLGGMHGNRLLTHPFLIRCA